jgi:hypothetical protein
MEVKEVMEKLFGADAPYPGMKVEWEVFAGKGAMESGLRTGEITNIRFCPHCGLPEIEATTEHGAEFSIRMSETENRWVCGIEAPK